MHTQGQGAVYAISSQIFTQLVISRDRTRITNLPSKASQDNMHETIDKNNNDNTAEHCSNYPGPHWESLQRSPRPSPDHLAGLREDRTFKGKGTEGRGEKGTIP